MGRYCQRNSGIEVGQLEGLMLSFTGSYKGEHKKLRRPFYNGSVVISANRNYQAG